MVFCKQSLCRAEDLVTSPSWRKTHFQRQGQRQEFSNSCPTPLSSPSPLAEALLCVPGSSKGQTATTPGRWPCVLFPHYSYPDVLPCACLCTNPLPSQIPWLMFSQLT